MLIAKARCGEAFDRIRDICRRHEERPDEGRTQWNLLDKPVCRRAWKKLHGMGFVAIRPFFGFEMQKIIFQEVHDYYIIKISQLPYRMS